MTEYRNIVEAILEAMPKVKVPKGMEAGLKFTSPTQTTHGGFAWPDPGKWTPDFGEDWDRTLCAGGGVHAATTIQAAQSGGGRYTHAMLVCWRPSEAATSPVEPGKVKARRIKSLCRIDMRELLVTYLYGADLYGANLSGADLYRADLYRANLSGANLSGANLSGANLSGANLYRADLSGANLYGANLYRANLYGADLYRANLSGANLSGADLSRANLYGANLSGANLYGADLYRANLYGANLAGAAADKWTRWPEGFDPASRGVEVVA